jgi:uncharacterized peroxidase-related enzyme
MARERSSFLRLPNVTRPAPAIRALWDESRARLGYVREFLKLPFEPERLALFQGYVNRLMRGADARLSGRERELVALVVSIENRCEACVITHAGALQAHGAPKPEVDVLLANWRRAPLSARERAMAEYAALLTLAPQRVEEASLSTLRAAKVSEAEILELVQVIAVFNATNRLNTGLGTKVDAGAHDKFRT